MIEGDRIFISDLHIGGIGYDDDALVAFLRTLRTRELFLLGDIIDTWATPFIVAHATKAVDVLEGIAENIAVTYVLGNHDEEVDLDGARAAMLRPLQLVVTLNESKLWPDVKLVHGHEVDDRVKKLYPLAGISHRLGEWLWRRCGLNARRWVRTPGNTSGTRADAHANEITQELCIRYGLRGYDTVIFGHTHRPGQGRVVVRGREISWYNCGDCIQNFSCVVERDRKREVVTRVV